MQLLALTLALLYVLEPIAFAVVIPRPLQAHLSLDPIVRRSLGTTASGLRFYRRKAILRDDWGQVHGNGRLPDAAYIPKAKREPTAPFVLGSGAKNADGERHIFVSNHGQRRSFHPRILARRRPSALGTDTANSGIQGIPGTIDIMSPTVDSPVGEKIASLSVSTEASEENQFILNASGKNASTVYLVVKNITSMQDGTLNVALQVPVFDQAKASYVPYCAAFDTTQASPLITTECSDQEISDHSSQLFSYNSSSGVIRPLWLTSSPLPDTESPSLSKEEDVGSDNLEEPEESDPIGPSDSSNSTTPAEYNVSLIFTPELDSSTPIINSQSSDNDAESGSDLIPISSSTSTSSTVDSGAFMNMGPSSDASITSTPTAQDVDASAMTPTMCRGSPMALTPTPPVAVSGGIQLSGDTEFSPMTEESISTTPTSSTESDAPIETSIVSRRQDIGVDDENEDEDEETDEEDQATLPDETSDQDATKRIVDTAYIWRFSSLQ